MLGGGESELFSIMEQYREYQLGNQPISNDDIRLSILRLANKNGGLKSLAEKSNISYQALWGQLNRNAGVLAYTIPLIVQGSGSLEPMQELGDGCEVAVSWAVKPTETPGDIIENALDIHHEAAGATEIIKAAYADKRFTKNEIQDIHSALMKVCQKVRGIDFRLEAISR